MKHGEIEVVQKHEDLLPWYRCKRCGVVSPFSFDLSCAHYFEDNPEDCKPEEK